MERVALSLRPTTSHCLAPAPASLSRARLRRQGVRDHYVLTRRLLAEVPGGPGLAGAAGWPLVWLSVAPSDEEVAVVGAGGGGGAVVGPSILRHCPHVLRGFVTHLYPPVGCRWNPTAGWHSFAHALPLTGPPSLAPPPCAPATQAATC